MPACFFAICSSSGPTQSISSLTADLNAALDRRLDFVTRGNCTVMTPASLSMTLPPTPSTNPRSFIEAVCSTMLASNWSITQCGSYA